MSAGIWGGLDAKRCFDNFEFAERGGHLSKLFWWQAGCTLVAVLLVALALSAGLQPWQLHNTLFWVRTLSGLSCFPFLLFRLPGLNLLLMHTANTGYNAAGELVVVRTQTAAASAAATSPTRGRNLRQ